MKKRKLRSNASSITLPSERKVVDSANLHTLFLYGPEGIGKSTFASEAPEPFFIATEAGLKFISCYQEPCPDWDAFREIVKALVALQSKKSGPKYRTVVIDTADNAFDQCQQWVCDKLGIEHPADEDWGKGYQAVRQEFNSQITRLALFDMRFIMTSHEKAIEVKGRVVKTSKIVPTLANTGRRVILPMCDMIGHYTFKMGRDGEPTSRRVINFAPSDLYEAKDRTGLMPKTLVIPAPPGCYDEFNNLVSGKAKKATKKRSSKKKSSRRRVPRRRA